MNYVNARGTWYTEREIPWHGRHHYYYTFRPPEFGHKHSKAGVGEYQLATGIVVYQFLKCKNIYKQVGKKLLTRPCPPPKYSSLSHIGSPLRPLPQLLPKSNRPKANARYHGASKTLLHALVSLLTCWDPGPHLLLNIYSIAW